MAEQSSIGGRGTPKGYTPTYRGEPVSAPTPTEEIVSKVTPTKKEEKVTIKKVPGAYTAKKTEVVATTYGWKTLKAGESIPLSQLRGARKGEATQIIDPTTGKSRYVTYTGVKVEKGEEEQIVPGKVVEYGTKWFQKGKVVKEDISKATITAYGVTTPKGMMDITTPYAPPPMEKVEKAEIYTPPMIGPPTIEPTMDLKAEKELIGIRPFEYAYDVKTPEWMRREDIAPERKMAPFVVTERKITWGQQLKDLAYELKQQPAEIIPFALETGERAWETTERRIIKLYREGKIGDRKIWAGVGRPFEKEFEKEYKAYQEKVIKEEYEEPVKEKAEELGLRIRERAGVKVAKDIFGEGVTRIPITTGQMAALKERALEEPKPGTFAAIAETPEEFEKLAGKYIAEEIEPEYKAFERAKAEAIEMKLSPEGKNYFKGIQEVRRDIPIGVRRKETAKQIGEMVITIPTFVGRFGTFMAGPKHVEETWEGLKFTYKVSPTSLAAMGISMVAIGALAKPVLKVGKKITAPVFERLPFQKAYRVTKLKGVEVGYEFTIKESPLLKEFIKEGQLKMITETKDIITKKAPKIKEEVPIEFELTKEGGMKIIKQKAPHVLEVTEYTGKGILKVPKRGIKPGAKVKADVFDITKLTPVKKTYIVTPEKKFGLQPIKMEAKAPTVTYKPVDIKGYTALRIKDVPLLDITKTGKVIEYPYVSAKDIKVPAHTRMLKRMVGAEVYKIKAKQLKRGVTWEWMEEPMIVGEALIKGKPYRKPRVPKPEKPKKFVKVIDLDKRYEAYRKSIEFEPPPEFEKVPYTQKGLLGRVKEKYVEVPTEPSLQAQLALQRFKEKAKPITKKKRVVKPVIGVERMYRPPPQVFAGPLKMELVTVGEEIYRPKGVQLPSVKIEAPRISVIKRRKVGAVVGTEPRVEIAGRERVGLKPLVDLEQLTPPKEEVKPRIGVDITPIEKEDVAVGLRQVPIQRQKVEQKVQPPDYKVPRYKKPWVGVPAALPLPFRDVPFGRKRKPVKRKRKYRYMPSIVAIEKKIYGRVKPKRIYAPTALRVIPKQYKGILEKAEKMKYYKRRRL